MKYTIDIISTTITSSTSSRRDLITLPKLVIRVVDDEILSRIKSLSTGAKYFKFNTNLNNFVYYVPDAPTAKPSDSIARLEFRSSFEFANAIE